MITNHITPDNMIVDEEYSKEVRGHKEPSDRPSTEIDTERGDPHQTAAEKFNVRSSAEEA
jgi:hypothetical protein